MLQGTFSWLSASQLVDDACTRWVRATLAYRYVVFQVNDDAACRQTHTISPLLKTSRRLWLMTIPVFSGNHHHFFFAIDHDILLLPF